MTGWQALSIATLGVSAVIAAPLVAEAQSTADLFGTNYTRSSPIFADGALTGCMVEFGTLQKDWVYANGGIVVVQGGFGFAAANGNLGAILKVNVLDVALDSTTPNPPTRAYLIAADLSTNLESVIQATPSDAPGSIFVIATLDPAFDIVAQALQSGKLTIAFNKGSGATDIQVSLDLEVLEMNSDGTRVKGPTTIIQFGECMEKLIEQLL